MAEIAALCLHSLIMGINVMAVLGFYYFLNPFLVWESIIIQHTYLIEKKDLNTHVFIYFVFSEYTRATYATCLKSVSK